MNKTGKKFMALLVVFTSIISFLPVGFSGQAAKAVTIGADATAIQVNVSGNATSLTARTDTTSTSTESIYTTQNVESDGFDLSVKDVRIDKETLVTQAKSNGQSTSGIVGQKVDIVSINGTPVTAADVTDYGTPSEVTTLGQIGIGIKNYNQVLGIPNRIGKTIKGLPLGVNKIVYKITITTQDIVYTPAVKDSNNVTIQEATAVSKDPVDTVYDNIKLTIEHATTFVINKIKPMTFNAYVGKKADLDSDTSKQNNTVPFKFSTVATADSNMALRYTFDVPDSISTLEYNMKFDTSMVLDNAKVYKNGVQDNTSTYNVTDHVLTGNLARLGQPDIIVVKLDSSTGDNTIQKAYAIEIRYNNLSSDKDYSLNKAGITKLNYDNDSSVSAYVGKSFTIDHTNTFPTYNGEITIDKKAGMICLDPTLIRTKDTVAYVVTNNYVDDSGNTQVKKSELKNGKQFIDFMAGSTYNTLQVDVYEGKDGNITNSSTILARYCFKVNKLTDNDFTMGLKFTSSSDTYLTQPGVKGNGIEQFNINRRTYDLYSGDPVTVALSTNRSTKNEYIRVWLADEINSNNLQEAKESSNNELINYTDLTKDGYLERNPSLNITFGKSKKMVVQAYYDEFEYDSTKEGNPVKTNSDGMPIYKSYPIGDKYVFYLPNNFSSSDNPTPGEKSENASLSLLKIADGTLKDTDGNSGFSSDKFDYTVMVPKEDTSAKITATAQDDNIQSIVATIDGGKDSYDLVSGEVSELPLNSKGKTAIKIVVTAQNGTTSKTYNVTVQNNLKGNNVNLKNVILNVGDYTFDSKADTTKVRVDQNVTSIKVTPLAEDSKSKVTVNGEEFLESPISVSIKGTQKTEINIEVISEDGTDSKTYTLDIYRVDVADWENNSDNGNDANEDDQFYDEYSECWVDLTKYDQWGIVNGKPAYFDKKNRQVKEAWITTGGKLYYLNNLGYRASGWKVDDADGKTYYLDPKTGELKKGWMNLNNSWYYLQLNGVMQKGWLTLNKKWYYFTENGQMVTNQSMYIDDRVYNFGQDGVMYY